MIKGSKTEKKGKKGGGNSRKAERILNDVYENGGMEEERPWFCKRSTTSWLVSLALPVSTLVHPLFSPVA